jgi:iron complex outermembrane receptor protein
LNPTQHLTLSGNVAYIDGTYKSFLRAPNINSVLVDASGNKVINAPKWQYLVQGAYDFDVSSNVSGSAQLTWRWRDVIYYQPTNQDLAHLRSDQDGELGARLQFDVKPSDFSVAVYGTNIADERVVTGMGLAFGYPSVNFNKPRSFGIELEKKF